MRLLSADVLLITRLRFRVFLQAAVHALLSWVSVSQVYACMSALALAGGADPPASE